MEMERDILECVDSLPTEEEEGTGNNVVSTSKPIRKDISMDLFH